MNKRSISAISLVIVLFALAIPAAIYAQEANGKIIGTVKDPQGAVVPGAKVTVTNTSTLTTQISREATTDENGNYQVLSLPIGTYEVAVERQGFKRFVNAGSKLEINQVLRVDAQLEVGTTSEVVNVVGQAASIETVNPTVGHSVTSRPIVDLPLNGRNVMQLALLQPGVTETNPSDGGGSQGFTVAGSRSDAVTYLLDGGVNNNLLSNRLVYNPNPDGIAEFRILESNYTAEYGRNGGGVISVVTKSGNNDLHFTLFEFLRNNSLNANSFFNNLNGLPRDVLKRNQFGGTVGGPIMLPRFGEGGRRLFDFRNKAFFFVSYQGQRLVQTQTTSLITVFTPAELAGNFSLSNSTHTGPDARVVTFLNANPSFQPNPALRAQGIIDPTRINAVAKNYISAGMIPSNPNGRQISSGGAVNDSDEFTMKFDVNMRKEDKLGITLGRINNPTIAPFSAVNVPGFPIATNRKNYFANISYTTIFSPQTLNEFVFTANRDDQQQAVPQRQLPTASQLGIAVTPDNPTGPPRLVFNSGMQVGFSPQGPTTLINNTFTFLDTLSWIKGNHNWKFGGSYSTYQNNTVFDFFVNGEFDFDGAAANGGIGSGNDLADLLFGLPDTYLQFGEAPSDIRTRSIYGFAQDEWRIRKNLTFTLGVRYEYNQPKYDTRGRSFSIVQGAHSQRFPNAPTSLLFPGDPGAPRGSNFSDFNDWAPRFGFAWSPLENGKTSIRGGFGVFYDILKGEDNLQFNGQAPFFGFTQLFMSPAANTFSDPFANTGQPNPFPSRPPAPNIDFGAAGFLPFGGGGVFFVDPSLRTPYVYQYNLTVQRELFRNLIAEVGYVGSASHKLTDLIDRNPFVLGTFHRVLNTLPGNTDTSFSFLDEFRNVANANYNSLQASLNKGISNTRFLGTTYFTLAYTWSHSIDNASGFRNRNSRVPTYNAFQFRANSDFDVSHRIVFSGGWDVPLDRWWESGPKSLIGGWSIRPITSYRSGFPLDVFGGGSRSRTRPGPSAAGDPNLVRAVLLSPIALLDARTPNTFNSRTGNYYFNPATFGGIALLGGSTCNACVTNPALRTYGSLPRNAFRGPSRTNLDLEIAKVTPLFGEKLKMEFRAEFFNILNSVQFRDPNTSITSGTFGQISTTYDPRIIQFGLKFTY